MFYSNIVVALGPKYEISSSVGSAVLYSHEFPLSINFKRAMNRRELVCYGVSSQMSLPHCPPLAFQVEVHQESTFIKDISLSKELAAAISKESRVTPEKGAGCHGNQVKRYEVDARETKQCADGDGQALAIQLQNIKQMTSDHDRVCKQLVKSLVFMSKQFNIKTEMAL